MAAGGGGVAAVEGEESLSGIKTTQMTVKNVVLSERSQTQKATYSTIPFI